MGSNMKAWTFRILRNQFQSDRRRSWRTEPLDPGVAERALVAADDPSAALGVSDVRRGMMQLSVEQREALILIGAAGMSYEEAAGICQTAIGTMKSRVSRARAALQIILDLGDLGDADVPPSEAAAAIYRDAESLRAVGPSRSGRGDPRPTILGRRLRRIGLHDVPGQSPWAARRSRRQATTTTPRGSAPRPKP
jgi:RNA polymerase sigma-70 factor, ECF subfamily